MSVKITDECISCGACEPVCPNMAISEGKYIFEIDPNLCTECIGFHDEPQCVSVCPVDCIPPDEDNVETPEQLLAKAFIIHADDPAVTREQMIEAAKKLHPDMIIPE